MTYQRDYDRTLRVGLVGVGGHAYRNILPALHYLPVQLVALCDLDESALRRTASEYGVTSVYNDAARMYDDAGLDAVLLCVGPQQHPKLASDAMAAGLHVWMEKPPATRAAEVEAMIAARGDRVCAVGFKKAYMPAARKAKELLSLPEFGSLRSILAVYPMTIPRDGHRVLESGRYGNWLANGCHPLSLMLYLGGRVQEVTTLLGPGAEAVGVAYLGFATGAVGVFHLAGGAPSGHNVERYDLFGTGRALSVENSERISYHRGIPFAYSTQRDFTAPGTDTGSVTWEAGHHLATLENKAIFVQGIFDELFDFCSAVLDAAPLRVGDLEFALEVMRVYEAALQSGGRPVTLPDPSQTGATDRDA